MKFKVKIYGNGSGIKPQAESILMLRSQTSLGGLTATAAERLGRRWMIGESMLDNLRTGGKLFRNCEGLRIPVAAEGWPWAA